MIKFVMVLLSLTLCGCWTSRAETEAQTEKHDTWTINASFPQVDPVTGTSVMIPINATIERFGNEVKMEKSETKAGLDEEKIKSLIASTIQAGFTGLTGLRIPESKAWSGFTAVESGTMASTAAAAAWAIKEMLAKRREQQALLEVKQARNEAQAQALDLAKKIDPKTA
jgi:hypothetical protein